MCDICQQFDLDYHAAISRGDTRTAAVKLALWESHRLNTCRHSNWLRWQKELAERPQPLQPELKGVRE